MICSRNATKPLYSQSHGHYNIAIVQSVGKISLLNIYYQIAMHAGLSNCNDACHNHENKSYLEMHEVDLLTIATSDIYI